MLLEVTLQERTKISSSVGRRKSRQGGCVNNDTRIRNGLAKILRGDKEWPRQCATLPVRTLHQLVRQEG